MSAVSLCDYLNSSKYDLVVKAVGLEVKFWSSAIVSDHMVRISWATLLFMCNL